MIEMMTFPDTWEEYEKSYGFTDNEEVYTNGARLIPSFRVKQWLDYLLSAQSELANNSPKLDKENGELISRQAAIDDLHGRDPSQIWDVADIEVWLNALPSVQPDVPDTNVGELIRKQDAIETALIFFVEYFGGAFHENAQKELMARLQRLPSVQPDKDLIHLQKEQAYMQGYADGQKPRKGKWIITSEFKDCYYAKCNQCKVTQVFYYNKPLTNFCPNCGARMVDKDE